VVVWDFFHQQYDLYSWKWCLFGILLLVHDPISTCQLLFELVILFSWFRRIATNQQQKSRLTLNKRHWTSKEKHIPEWSGFAPCPLALECFFKINQRGSKGEWVQPVWVMGLSDQGDMRKSKGGWFHKEPKAIFLETSDILRALFSFWSTMTFETHSNADWRFCSIFICFWLEHFLQSVQHINLTCDNKIAWDLSNEWCQWNLVPYSEACHERKHSRFVISDVRFFSTMISRKRCFSDLKQIEVETFQHPVIFFSFKQVVIKLYLPNLGTNISLLKTRFMIFLFQRGYVFSSCRKPIWGDQIMGMYTHVEWCAPSSAWFRLVMGWPVWKLWFPFIPTIFCFARSYMSA